MENLLSRCYENQETRLLQYLKEHECTRQICSKNERLSAYLAGYFFRACVQIPKGTLEKAESCLRILIPSQVKGVVKEAFLMADLAGVIDLTKDSKNNLDKIMSCFVEALLKIKTLKPVCL